MAGKRVETRFAVLVSSDQALVHDLTRALGSGGFRVENSRTTNNALNRLRKSRADLLIIDTRGLRESDVADTARIAAPAKRAQESVVLGKLGLDPASRIATWNRRQAQLTSTESALLIELIRHRGQTVTRDELLDSLGDHGRVFDRTIDRHICNLRRKLEPTPKASSIIVTVHGIGYRLNIKA